jgi:predicted nucleic acid-binding protein
MNTFIDATVFLAMHSADESIRIAAKNFFVEHFDKPLSMTLEDVGKCDDVIWQYGREEQDLYYPFMDRLHTVMNIQRVPYTLEAIEWMRADDQLSVQQRLLLSMAAQKKANVVTADSHFAQYGGRSVELLAAATTEKQFSKELERCYQESLALQLKT